MLRTGQLQVGSARPMDRAVPDGTEDDMEDRSAVSAAFGVTESGEFPLEMVAAVTSAVLAVVPVVVSAAIAAVVAAVFLELYQRVESASRGSGCHPAHGATNLATACIFELVAYWSAGREPGFVRYVESVSSYDTPYSSP